MPKRPCGAVGKTASLVVNVVIIIFVEVIRDVEVFPAVVIDVGYGYAKAGKDLRREWAALVDGYIRDVLERALVVMLVDGKVGATALDAQAYEDLSSLGADLVVAPTKIDKVPRGRRTGVKK